MADAAASARGAVRSLAASFGALSLEQKVAAIASLLLVASTFGPFSFVEAAEIATALGVLALLHFRAQGRRFHLPFGDGAVIAAAGVWVGLLIVVRLFDRPLGQNLLALACAAILAVAGASEHAKRPPDDLPDEPRARRPRRPRAPDGRPGPVAAAVEEPLAPPEFEPPASATVVARPSPPAERQPTRPVEPQPTRPAEDETTLQLSLEDALGDAQAGAPERAPEGERDADAEPTRRLPRDQG